MSERTYVVRIQAASPELGRTEIDAAMRRAVTYLSEDLDPDGEDALSIEVVDDRGSMVTAHWYDPEDL